MLLPAPAGHVPIKTWDKRTDTSVVRSSHTPPPALPPGLPENPTGLARTLADYSQALSQELGEARTDEEFQALATAALADIGDLFDVDVAVLHMLEQDVAVENLLWHRAPTAPQQLLAVGASLDEVAPTAAPFLRLGAAVPFEDPASVPLTDGERAMVAASQFGSMLYIPVSRGGSLAALLFFANIARTRSWEVDGASGWLRFLGELLSTALVDRKLQRELDRSKARAEAIAAQVADALIVYGVEGEIRYASPSVTRVLGYHPADMVGTSGWNLIHPDDRALTIEAIGRVTREYARVSHRVRCADSSWRWMETTYAPLTYADELEILASTRDIHDHKVANDQLAIEVLTDPLTGLLNRAGLYDALGATLARSSAVVLFCDLDSFKVVNDTLGHDAGDEVLQVCARRIRDCVRPTDLAARLGGDEFVVALVGEVGLGVAAHVSQRLVERLAEPIPTCRGTANVTVSIGGTVAGPGRDTADVLYRADTAMYGAKRAGRNRVELTTS
jgi:diguanylate cyclase (GGDEF)-like protein/PAS domain S-box-containing protein